MSKVTTRTDMVNKDLEIKKSLMTHIHIILGAEPAKENTFISLDELYNKISAAMDVLQNHKAGYYGTELLDSFDDSIEWMKDRGIIIIFEGDEKNNSSIVQINKDKLVKYIVDQDLSEGNSNITK